MDKNAGGVPIGKKCIKPNFRAFDVIGCAPTWTRADDSQDVSKMQKRSPRRNRLRDSQLEVHPNARLFASKWGPISQRGGPMDLDRLEEPLEERHREFE